MSGRIVVHLRTIPAPLLTRIEDSARRRDWSLPNEVTSILSQHFQVDHAPTRAPFTACRDGMVSLRIPVRLHRKWKATAARRGGTMRSLALQILEQHYDQ